MFSWSDGRVYRGQWNSGQQHGKGVAIDTNGVVTRGIWHYGQMVERTAVSDPSSQRGATLPDGMSADSFRESSSVDSAAGCRECGADTLPQQCPVVCGGGA